MSTQRSTCWSVTINNPTPHDEEYIALARQKGWKVEGQLERGVQGTLHYQLCVKTPQVRFSQVKKAFPRAHIEVARNPDALLLYTQKSDTAVAPLQVQSQLYPSLSKFWELIFDRLGEVWHEPRTGNTFKHPMIVFDKMVSILITEGYYVESLACNPLTRAMWKNYHSSIIQRQRTLRDRQTDRQDDLFSQPLVIPNADETSSSLPEETGPSREGDAPPSGAQAE